MGNYAQSLRMVSKPLATDTREDVHDILLGGKSRLPNRTVTMMQFMSTCVCTSAETDVKETAKDKTYHSSINLNIQVKDLHSALPLSYNILRRLLS